MPQLAPCLPEPYPAVITVEGVAVDAFPNPQSLFARVAEMARQPGQQVVHYLNIHVANTAFRDAALKQALQRADLVYCDGAGIVTASRWLGTPLPTRLTAADWLIDMLADWAVRDCSVYLLGGAPEVPALALARIAEQVPHHRVLGAHHGYILNDEALEAHVIEEINALKPDILIVGLGTPLQERWIARHREQLNVPVLYAIGAVMDFVSGRVSRCPRWMGDAGLEWLYRLGTEPTRLLGRYVLGNPWFLARIAWQALTQKGKVSR